MEQTEQELEMVRQDVVAKDAKIEALEAAADTKQEPAESIEEYQEKLAEYESAFEAKSVEVSKERILASNLSNVKSIKKT